MGVANGDDAFAADKRSAVPNKGRGRRSRRRTLVLAAYLSAALPVTVLLYGLAATADALCLPSGLPSGGGRRLRSSPRRAPAGRSSSTELVLLPRRRDESPPSPDLGDAPRSPASASPLFVSPARRLARDVRLGYKDHQHDADELLHIIDARRQVATRTGILSRAWPRRRGPPSSKSKALFPTVVDRRFRRGDEGLVSYDLLDGIARGKASLDEEGGERDEAPAAGLNRVGKLMGKKKRRKVAVSNVRELHDVVLDKGFELRDVELKYAPPPSLRTSKRRRQREPADEAERPTSEPDSNENEPQAQAIDLSSLRVELEGDDDEPNAAEWQLIGNVLAEDCPFSSGDDDDEAEAPPSSPEPEPPFSHDVLNLLRERYRARSTPSSRPPDDTARLALSIEGGGMRGAVSYGMAAAVACLGLSDAFDAVYGSSAGSVIGSYFVSRQLYLDVYSDVLPAGRDLFVKKSKILGDVFRNAFRVIKERGAGVGPLALGKRLNANLIERWTTTTTNATSSMEALPPTRAGGLNISFVLDSIMCPERGLRPLDLEAFSHNDAVQPLRIVSSAVELETGKLKTACFGSKEGHFRDGFGDPRGPAGRDVPPTDGESLYPATSAAADEDGARRGLWACLGASMLVPGAADSPFRLHLPSTDGPDSSTSPHLCFDAFCYEPVPFRSAVAEGATHVLALRSRPAGFVPKTRPTLYERAVAPLYFRSNGVPDSVASFFERGGQQYLYAEDVLTCDRGLDAGGPIPIPPAKVLYAAPEAEAGTDREGWARAHLLPITVPADVPELSTLSQDRDDILRGMREGFAAAYDTLAPVVGLGVGPDALDGMTVAELVFPHIDADAPQESVLEKQFPLAGEKLGESTRAVDGGSIPSTHQTETVAGTDLSSVPARRARFRRSLSIKRAFRFSKGSRESVKATASTSMVTTSHHTRNADALLSFLPGLQLGTLPMVSERLQTYLESHSYLESD